jgi:hypothetical protein
VALEELKQAREKVKTNDDTQDKILKVMEKLSLE